MKYLHHILVSRHRKGMGIHSPYIFSFISEAIFNGMDISVPGVLEDAHQSLYRDDSILEIREFGAGSRVSDSQFRTVGSMAKRSSVSRKSGRLLYRISRWYNPEVIIELGSGLGISTAYMAMGFRNAEVFSIEGSEQKAGFAKKFLKSLGIENTSILTGQFDDLLPGLLNRGDQKVLVFMDGNHRYEPTLKYLSQLLSSDADEMIIVMDDIHWSNGMEKAWKEIREMEEVRVSLDLFFHGILLMNINLIKEDFIIKFP